MIIYRLINLLDQHSVVYRQTYNEIFHMKLHDQNIQQERLFKKHNLETVNQL
jgi:hypothetical protein